MKLFCIETSSALNVIGIVEDIRVLSERVIENRDTLVAESGRLFSECEIALKDIDALAIGIGPGSFTGLRVGLAYAKGLARALNIPIWPVPSLQVFAANLKGQCGSITAITPARRGQCHAQSFAGSDLAAATEARVVEYERVRDLLSDNAALVGPGIAKLEAKLAVDLSDFIPRDPELHRAHALTLAELARARWKTVDPPRPGEIVPEYGLDFGA